MNHSQLRSDAEGQRARARGCRAGEAKYCKQQESHTAALVTEHNSRKQALELRAGCCRQQIAQPQVAGLPGLRH